MQRENLARPQIEVVRLPSNERAKITLDGVQLRAQYNHFRTGDYVRACAVSNNALDRCASDARMHRSEELLLRAQDSDASAHCYHFCLRKRANQSVEALNAKNKKMMSTKSCDNIFDKYLVKSKAKFGWKESTRSEEHLSCIGVKPPLSNITAKTRDRETASSTGGLAGRLVSRLLRRLRHAKSRESDVMQSREEVQAPQPWILVSFSRRDLEGEDEDKQQQAAGGAVAEVQSSAGRRTSPTSQRHDGASDMHVELQASLASQQRRPPLRVPPARLVPRHHRSRHHRGSGRVLATPPGSGRVLATLAGRPHTLYLTEMEQRGTLRKMAASFESIGSCSLDADITARLVESRGGCAESLSQRTLHSLDSQKLVAHSTEELSTSSKHYVKRATKLFDPADDASFNTPRARPSYVSLSCSVSGYSRATNYSSSRLRDPSPCARQNGTPLLLSRRKPVSTMNGHDTMDCANLRNNLLNAPSSTYKETTTWHSVGNKTDAGLSNGANTSKSFIQQRVERLYGRGALAQGFFKQTKLNGDNGSRCKPALSGNEPASLPELPVLRLLRPEFREQLSINSPHSTPWWRHKQTPLTCNGDSTEHIIPITLEADHPSLPDTQLGSDMTGSVKVDVATQAQEAPRDLQPAAPEVVIAVEVAATKPQTDDSIKDGHYFLKLLGAECERLLAMATETEKELESTPDLSEEVSGKLRAAIGQARLLVRQKLQQFEGLCHRNLSENAADEQFPTTCDDLAGFWDMVQLQVAHVDALFQELTEMQARGWQELSPARHVVKPRRSSTNTTPKASPKVSEKAQEAARARDEQRKKMMEERRRVAKLNKNKEAAVEIFAPEN